MTHIHGEILDRKTALAEKSAAQQAIEERMESLVGYILQVGVLVSGALIIAGVVWNLIATHSLNSDYLISGENFFGFLVASLRQLFTGGLGPHLLINLGIVSLMLTPYLRVAASTLYFAFVAHNRKYTVITLFVLVVLTYSLFLR